jgi:hypothetical protein
MRIKQLWPARIVQPVAVLQLLMPSNNCKQYIQCCLHKEQSTHAAGKWLQPIQVRFKGMAIMLLVQRSKQCHAGNPLYAMHSKDHQLLHSKLARHAFQSKWWC